jgi:hypothetical protein
LNLPNIRGDYFFLHIGHSETRIACGCHVFLSNQYEIMIFRKGPFKQNSCFQFANINKIVSYKSILFILANQKQELLNLNWPIDEKGGD